MRTYALLAWRLLDRGLLVGAALLGMTVLCLGGAGVELALAYAAIGVVVVTVHDTMGMAGAAVVGLCAVFFGAGGMGTLVTLTGAVALLVIWRRRAR